MGKILIYFFATCAFCLFFYSPIFAADFLFLNAPSEVYQNDEFRIDLVVDAKDKSLNAVGGSILVPKDYFAIKEIIDGDSGINFWVEKPSIAANGAIVFSGIVPGGFSGKLKLFSAILSGKKIGKAEIVISSPEALLNDGSGTADKTTVYSPRLTVVQPAKGRLPLVITIEDSEPPENFLPEIISSPEVYRGGRTLIFETEDKISGLDRYEVLEKKTYRFLGLSVSSGDWQRAKSPCLLKDQKLKSEIFVKAVDKRGNERLARLAASSPIYWYENVLFWGIILLLAPISIALFCVYATRRKNK